MPLLFLPFFALPVFWLWPASLAVSAWYAVKVAKLPPLYDTEGLPGAKGRVMQCGERDLTLSIHGELWWADADAERLSVGDEAIVVRIQGLRLRVRKAIE